MAIKIGGDEVIDNSKNVVNVAAGTFSSKVTSAETASEDADTTLTTKGYVDSLPAKPTGGGSDEIFWQNSQNVTTDYTVPSGKNALSAGPITIDNGITVTISANSEWSIV